jgi:hypothetical protein
MGLAVAAVVLFVANVAASLVHQIYPQHFAAAVASSCINLILTVVTLVWVFQFRNRLNEFFAPRQENRYWLGGVLTFFFGVLYLQYKLNQLIDREKSVTVMDPLAAGAAA